MHIGGAFLLELSIYIYDFEISGLIYEESDRRQKPRCSCNHMKRLYFRNIKERRILFILKLDLYDKKQPTNKLKIRIQS